MLGLLSGDYVMLQLLDHLVVLLHMVVELRSALVVISKHQVGMLSQGVRLIDSFFLAAELASNVLYLGH